MSFAWTPAQQRRYDEIVAFARAQLSPGHRARDRDARFDRDVWTRAATEGLAGLPVPRQYGGRGCSALDTILAVEALGYGCEDGGLAFSLCAHTFACAVPVWKAGDAQHRARFLPRLASGEWIGAGAITEPEAGSDVFALRTTAVRTADGYRLSGTKRFITNAPVADVFLVFATVDAKQGMLGVTAFLVPGGTPGLEVSGSVAKTGLRSCAMGEIRLDGCCIGAEQRIGGEGAGGLVFCEAMRWERTCLFAVSVGAMQRQLEACVEHARTRTQFGQPVGKFQSIANRLVDMKLRLEASRCLLYRSGWLLDQGGQSDVESAISKLFISESAVQSALDAIQIFGGSGILESEGIEVALRDAVPGRIYSGTSEIQRRIIADGLGL